ncbi:Survival of motor neuron-related-splicing factor 30 [Ceratobasidium theobromae]|uniref:Survival of motor neuron-related-splicing factor 30 n=1 Tax=Ceratobasidium theobromae TaxID=1582974 RepID=A0A5N5QRH7_9AGAM|nr:Survival of motor neuron-related-splicing factor 30 [Ceratobasidium theobromae]
MDKNELETYQVQLSQVELALTSDPDNEELTSLRSELKELILLTETALAQAEGDPSPAPAASGSAQQGASTSSNVSRSKPTPAASLQAGDECLAKYSSDGQWYPARITSVGGSDERRVFSIVFKGYNSTELVDAASLKPMPANYRNHNPVINKRKLTKEEEEEREKKKKKNEKKLEVRAQKAKEQNNKQAAWQKFAKKSEKKGVAIAGVQGNSIFRTPDNPYGRGQFCLLIDVLSITDFGLAVGVTGSGRGMTEYAAREKHKFVADESAS